MHLCEQGRHTLARADPASYDKRGFYKCNMSMRNIAPAFWGQGSGHGCTAAPLHTVYVCVDRLSHCLLAPPTVSASFCSAGVYIGQGSL